MADKPQKRKPGRPTVWTPEVENKILSAVRGGNYIETAAAFAGINKVTLYARLKAAGRKNARPADVAFSNALQKALADAEVRDVTVIGQAAKDQWQAAAWRLERKHPDRWGRKDTIRVLKEQAKEEAAREVAAAPVEDLLAQMDYEYAGTDAAS